MKRGADGAGWTKAAGWLRERVNGPGAVDTPMWLHAILTDPSDEAAGDELRQFLSRRLSVILFAELDAAVAVWSTKGGSVAPFASALGGVS
jgi:hypothetical protein